MVDRIPNIYSHLTSNRNILILGKGSDIQNSHFSGINFENNKNIYYSKTEEELVNFKSFTFSHIFIHGFDFREFNITLLKSYDISYLDFCIDLLGEGFDIDTLLMSKQEWLENNSANIKILIPFNHYNNLEEKYKKIHFFKYDLGGPRIFCSRFNRTMIHKYEDLNKVCAGLHWRDDKKDKLFMCLNKEPRVHRVKMVDSLINNNLLNIGYVTFKSNQKNFEYFNIDLTKSITYSIPQITIDDSLFSNNFFGLHPLLSSNSYVEVVTESRHDLLPFKTEKCVKPFYNLQFPIILGHYGIVNDLRKMDFDMFDDIIDHSYDLIEPITHRGFEGNDLSKKVSIITQQLIKLSKIDIHSLYLKNKERFIYNQENLFNKTIIENYIHRDLGKFIFGDAVKVYEANKDLIEKIYI
jgi:hypothetical protein